MTARIGILGALGRMGQAIAAEVLATSGAEISAVAELKGSDAIGQRYLSTGVLISDDARAVFAASDVVIDFTPPGNTSLHSDYARQMSKVYIVGTTGLTAEDHLALDRAGETAVVIQAGNFSLGVNLLSALTRKAASILGEDWDIEILEMHHRDKVDAPSGTAEMLGEAAAKGRNVSLDKAARRSREGVIGARPKGEIGFATLRGGSVIGEHEVIFASSNERLTIGHRAENRGLFAAGAVRAALWSIGRPHGRYTMQDVLGLGALGSEI